MRERRPSFFSIHNSPTDHLKRFGAIDVPRARYETLLEEALQGFSGVLTMASRLLLMRHAKAEWPSPGRQRFRSPSDDQRHRGSPVHGRDDGCSKVLLPDRVLCSGARRCPRNLGAPCRVFNVDDGRV